jgi:hypothetical protein
MVLLLVVLLLAVRPVVLLVLLVVRLLAVLLPLVVAAAAVAASVGSRRSCRAGAATCQFADKNLHLQQHALRLRSSGTTREEDRNISM